MQRLQAYRFELKPNGEQQRNMRRFAGSCPFVFNKALALQKERHGQGEKKLGYAVQEADRMESATGNAMAV
jgi:putative transposase